MLYVLSHDFTRCDSPFFYFLTLKSLKAISPALRMVTTNLSMDNDICTRWNYHLNAHLLRTRLVQDIQCTENHTSNSAPLQIFSLRRSRNSYPQPAIRSQQSAAQLRFQTSFCACMKSRIRCLCKQ